MILKLRFAQNRELYCCHRSQWEFYQYNTLGDVRTWDKNYVWKYQSDNFTKLITQEG